MAPEERGPRGNDPIDRLKPDDIANAPVKRGEGGPARGGDTGARPDGLVDGQAPASGGGVPQDAMGDLPVRGSDPMNDPEIKRIDQMNREALVRHDQRHGRPERPADAEPPPSEGPISDIKTVSGERAPTSDLPRTQEKPGTGLPRTREKPGTGAKDPKPEKPWKARERPTGQITDETGEYGPERTWYGGDGETDWNKVNRAPATPRRSVPRAAVGAAAVVAAAVIVFAVVRPGATTTPTATGRPAAGVATTAPAAATEPTGPSAQTAAALGYQCVGNQRALFDNSNGSIVQNGAASAPTLDTGGKPYCLVSMSTYHWNEGKGAGPGRVGLIGGGGNVGPVQAQGTSGQGGAQNVNWVYVPDPAARPLLLGSYTCYDSDRATWSANEASGRAGFCRVFVLEAVKQ